MQYELLSLCRISRLEVFCKKEVLENFAKFTGKHLCQILFFNAVAGLRRRVFSVNFAKLFRAPFHTERLWWLLLVMKEGTVTFLS